MIQRICVASSGSTSSLPVPANPSGFASLELGEHFGREQLHCFAYMIVSVASALLHYAQTISSKDPAERLSLYVELAAQLCDEELASIFEKAIGRLSPAAR